MEATGATNGRAPWVCRPCFHAFWDSELLPEWRARYRPHFRDWGIDAKSMELRKLVQAELEAQIEDNK